MNAVRAEAIKYLQEFNASCERLQALRKEVAALENEHAALYGKRDTSEVSRKLFELEGHLDKEISVNDSLGERMRTAAANLEADLKIKHLAAQSEQSMEKEKERKQVEIDDLER